MSNFIKFWTRLPLRKSPPECSRSKSCKIGDSGIDIAFRNRRGRLALRKTVADQTREKVARIILNRLPEEGRGKAN
jgi:hypothetical protein